MEGMAVILDPADTDSPPIKGKYKSIVLLLENEEMKALVQVIHANGLCRVLLSAG